MPEKNLNCIFNDTWKMQIMLNRKYMLFDVSRKRLITKIQHQFLNVKCKHLNFRISLDWARMNTLCLYFKGLKSIGCFNSHSKIAYYRYSSCLVVQFFKWNFGQSLDMDAMCFCVWLKTDSITLLFFVTLQNNSLSSFVDASDNFLCFSHIKNFSHFWRKLLVNFDLS